MCWTNVNREVLDTRVHVMIIIFPLIAAYQMQSHKARAKVQGHIAIAFNILSEMILGAGHFLLTHLLLDKLKETAKAAGEARYCSKLVCPCPWLHYKL